MFKYKSEAELTAMTGEQRDFYSEQKRTWEATQTKEQIEAWEKSQQGYQDAFKNRQPELIREYHHPIDMTLTDDGNWECFQIHDGG